MSDDAMKNAYADGASALGYRIERLRMMARDDDPLVRELLERWLMSKSILVQMAGGEHVRL